MEKHSVIYLVALVLGSAAVAGHWRSAASTAVITTRAGSVDGDMRWDSGAFLGSQRRRLFGGKKKSGSKKKSDSKKNSKRSPKERESSSSSRGNLRSLSTDVGGDIPAWRGRIDVQYERSYLATAIAENKCDGNQVCSHNGATYPYESYIVDPTDKQSNRPVIKVRYPAGSWAPSARVPGGTLFFAYPYKTDPTSTANPFSVKSAALEYEVYFPDDFDFMKGGKLPGMSGGGDRVGRGCGGGANAAAENCFSFRMMWRSGGAGEAYLYLPNGRQDEELCSHYPNCQGDGPYPCIECTGKAGQSFGRGAFFFKRGEWTTIRASMVLNDPGEANGAMQVEVNGKTVISYDRLKWRLDRDVVIEGFEFSTWFGGSDQTWAPRTDQYTLFRNLRGFRNGPSTSDGSGDDPTRDFFAGGNGTDSQVVLREVIPISLEED